VSPIASPGAERSPSAFVRARGNRAITLTTTQHGSEDGRYRLLIESITTTPIYMLDPAGRITSWNPGAERFKGYTAAEVLGSHFSRFYTPEDRDAGRPARALQSAAEAGRFEAEGWRVRKDGSRFWAHVVIDPIRRGEELIGFAKITRDLTERRASEEALRQSQEQFRILVGGVTDYAIYMLDPDGRVISWNAGAERIKAMRRTRSSVSISRASTSPRRRRRTPRGPPWPSPVRPAASKRRAGDCARTGRGSGRMW
jgi:PAS domain S-box-containing protein